MKARTIKTMAAESGLPAESVEEILRERGVEPFAYADETPIYTEEASQAVRDAIAETFAKVKPPRKDSEGRQMIDDTIHTVQEVADYLGVNHETVLALINSGELVASNVSSGTQRPRWRILASDVGKFLMRTRRQAEPKSAPTRKRRRKAAATKNYFPKGSH